MDETEGMGRDGAARTEAQIARKRLGGRGEEGKEGEEEQEQREEQSDM